MKRLSHNELAALHASKDWGQLWVQAIPWVKFAVSSFKCESREDATQEVLLHIGEQLSKWDPARGAFSQFILARARYEMLDYLRLSKHRSHSGKQKIQPPTQLTFLPDDEEDSETAAEPTYEDTGAVPQGFGSIEAELTRLGAAKAAEAFLRRLEPSLALRFRQRWGFPVLDEYPEDETGLPEVAAVSGVPETTLRRKFELAKNKWRERCEPRHTSNKASIYPPKGREPWPQFQPDANVGSFWDMGTSSAMGDCAVWRESVGSVYSDWSWKPLPSDIENGCKR